MKGSGLPRASEASHRLSFLFPFFFSSGSGPPSLSGRAELCSEASQPFKVNSSPGDVLLSKGWGEGREGARSKLPLK